MKFAAINFRVPFDNCDAILTV